MQQKQKMIIAGATGFIGTSLVEIFRKKFRIVILTRHIPESEKTDHQKDIEYVRWNDSNHNLQNAFKDCKILINLAGAGIGDKSWTEKRKAEILQSRTQSIRNLTGYMEKFQIQTDLIIQASATGFYGFDGNRVFVENDPAGKGFLAEVASSWEQAAEALRPFTKRMVIMRLGVVLSDKGGAFSKMVLPVKFGIGGPLGNGKQGFTWIHLEDVIGGISYLIENGKIEGIFNFVSPQILNQKDFTKIVAGYIHRPSFFSTPAWIIKLLLGQMGEELLIKGNKVKPERLLQSGFKYKYPDLSTALPALFRK